MLVHIRLLPLLLVLFTTATLFGQTAGEKVMIAYPSRSIASIDLYIAQERGFFRQEGLAAELVQVRGNIAVTALLSGEATAINNVGTLVRAMERSDLPTKVISQSLKNNLFGWSPSPKSNPSPN
jgi:ABC-type nitrate/sulfonate/bicarbonate transport system substrate-binding protein